MRRLLVLALVLAVATVGLAAAAPAWRRLPPAPLPAGPGARGTTDAVAVWTGKEMLVFARAHPDPPWSVDVSAAYDPARRTWRRLEPLAGPPGNYEGSYAAVWTGRELLVFGPADNQGYTPATNRWRRLRNGGSGPGEVLAWTGREVLTWGGGCCGDASNAGAAFDPATNTWRPLPASPLAPSQRPQGAWTGSELVVLVSGLDPNGEPYPARDARAAAYDPARRAWRRLAAPPERRTGATAIWDGREVLFFGGSAPTAGAARTRIGLAYDPARNRWRRLPRGPAFGYGLAAVRAGGRVLAWGGLPAHGAQYVPAAGRWFDLPAAPLRGRWSPALVWTGDALLVWGGFRANDGAELRL